MNQEFTFVITFVLAILTSWCLLKPFFSDEKLNVIGNNRLADLMQKKNLLLRAYQDLEAEYASEKLNADDYQNNKSALKREIANCLALIEQAEK
jgi:hypothetical protein